MHGSTPENCSQCLMSQPKIIKYDRDRRELLVDGAPATRGEPETPITQVGPPNRGKKMTGRRMVTCGICGERGHTRAGCGK